MFKKILSLSLSLSLLVGTTIPSSRAESLQSPTQQVISEKSSESKNSKDYYKKYKDIKKQYKKLSNKNQPNNKPSGWSNVIKHPFNIIFNSELYMFFGAIISGSIFDGYPTLCAALTAASGIYGGISEAKKFYKSN
mgnify:FL=1